MDPAAVTDTDAAAESDVEPTAVADSDTASDSDADPSAEADSDANGDKVSESVAVSDGDAEPRADAVRDAGTDAAAVAEATVADTRADALTASDAMGLGVAVGAHEGTGSANGLLTEKPTSMAHAFVPNVPLPPPSKTIAWLASYTRNDSAGTAPMPLFTAHPAVDATPSVFRAHAAAFAPSVAWSHSTGSPEGDDTAFVAVNHSGVSAGRPPMSEMFTDAME